MKSMGWKNKIDSFKKIDVRGIQGNFFQGIKKQAMNTPVGEGLEIVQSFDPIPLYEVMEELGFEHFTEQNGDDEFHAYFYRIEVKQEAKDISMRPAALTNMPLIDEKLGSIIFAYCLEDCQALKEVCLNKLLHHRRVHADLLYHRYPLRQFLDLHSKYLKLSLYPDNLQIPLTFLSAWR